MAGTLLSKTMLKEILTTKFEKTIRRLRGYNSVIMGKYLFESTINGHTHTISKKLDKMLEQNSLADTYAQPNYEKRTTLDLVKDISILVIQRNISVLWCVLKCIKYGVSSNRKKCCAKA
jgi:hypothetical protein